MWESLKGDTSVWYGRLSGLCATHDVLKMSLSPSSIHKTTFFSMVSKSTTTPSFGRSLLVWIPCLIFAHLTNLWSFSPSLNTERNVLPDVLHTLVDESWVDHSDTGSWLYGACDILLLPPLLLFLSCLFRAAPSARLHVLSDLMLVHSLLVVLRGILINVTSLPSPIKSCHHASERPASLFLTLFCNDQIFSGHTTVNLIFMAAVEFDVKTSRFIKVCGWFVVVFASFISVISRDHYTVDVVLAYTHTIGVMLLWRERISSHWRMGERDKDA